MIINECFLVGLFINIDDFCKALDAQTQALPSANMENNMRKSKCTRLSHSEIMTILVLYHCTYYGHRNFEYYYRFVVQKGVLRSYFPDACSYERFIQLIPRTWHYMIAYVSYLCMLNAGKSDIYYADSKTLAVCNNKRIKGHKVFKGMAARGKSSMGWFYGLKLFLAVNHLGEIVKVKITPGNIADNSLQLLMKLLSGIKGKVFADKGFINGQAQGLLNAGGTQLITKSRKNMKKRKLLTVEENYYLSKRGMIESIFDILTTQCDIEHTRHRSPVNAMVHILAGLVAYSSFLRKPEVKKARFSCVPVPVLAVA